MKIRKAALIAACVSIPSLALASGNNLTLSSGVAFSTTNPPPGGSGSMSGGYATTSGGVCYDGPSRGLGLPQYRTIYALTPTAAPLSPALIFGDQELYLAEDTNGHLVIGEGKIFAVGPAINDGTWHKLAVMVSYGGNGSVSATATEDGSAVVGFSGNFTSTGSVSDPSMAGTNLALMVTGIGGGPIVTSAGASLATFGGSLAEATCQTGTYNNPFGNWPLATNGSDISAPAQIPNPNSSISYNSAVPTPAGGFPLR